MEIRVDGPILIIRKADHKHGALLKERGGTRQIRITIDCAHNIAIDSARKNVETPEQTAHRLAINCIHTLGANIEKVVLYDCVKDGLVLSCICIRDEKSGQLLSINTSVLDALVVAAIEKCAIFVEENVFIKNSIVGAELQKMAAQEKALLDFAALDPQNSQKM